MQKINGLAFFAMVVLLLLGVRLFAAPVTPTMPQRQLDSIAQVLRLKEQQISSLEEKIEFLSRNQEAEVALINQSSQNLSNELSASSRTISAWGYIIAALALFFGAVIGIFVTKKYEQIKKLENAVDSAKRSVEQQLASCQNVQAQIGQSQKEMNQLADETKKTLGVALSQVKEFREIYSDFRKHSAEIYQHMRREETKAILRRLVEVPEDIANLADMLLSRTLEKEDFNALCLAYKAFLERERNTLPELPSKGELKTISVDKSEVKAYALIFYQHFFGLAINNELTADLVMMHLDSLCKGAFINDLLKSTKDLKDGLSTKSWDQKVDIMASYTIALSHTRYRGHEELMEGLLLGLTHEEIRSLWSKVSTMETQAIFFSSSVKNALQPLASDDPILLAINQYIADAPKTTSSPK